MTVKWSAHHGKDSDRSRCATLEGCGPGGEAAKGESIGVDSSSLARTFAALADFGPGAGPWRLSGQAAARGGIRPLGGGSGLAGRLSRGDVHLYRFASPDEERPVLVLTRDGATGHPSTVMVAPITTTVRDGPGAPRAGADAGGLPGAPLFIGMRMTGGAGGRALASTGPLFAS